MSDDERDRRIRAALMAAAAKIAAEQVARIPVLEAEIAAIEARLRLLKASS